MCFVMSLFPWRVCYKKYFRFDLIKKLVHYMFIFVSSANARKNKNGNTLVVFGQTVRLSSYKELTNCNRSFTICSNAIVLLGRS